jgi:hypothetical protein
VSRTAGRLLLEAEFRELARRVAEGAASERRPVYVPLRVTLRFGSPVVLTHPYVMLDGVIGHCMLLEYLGEDLYHVWAVKTPLGRYILEAADRLGPRGGRYPIRRKHGLMFASAAIWEPEGVRARTLMMVKRFEDRWAPGRRRISRGSGYFRDHLFRRTYVPASGATFYVHGDPEWLGRLLRHLPGLGDDVRIGFGDVREARIERIDRDRSVLDGDVAMRPIPVDMLEWWEESAVMAWKPPYWHAGNLAECCVPFTRVRPGRRLREALGPGWAGPDDDSADSGP